MLFFLLSLNSYALEIYSSNNQDVYICQESNVSEASVKKAIKYWQEKEHKINYRGLIENCDFKSFNKDSIYFISNKDLNTNRFYGMSTPYLLFNIVIYSTIEISDDYFSDVELLIHELGHSLGVEHSTHINDVMPSHHMRYNTNL